MNIVSFTEKMIALREEWLQYPTEDAQRNPAFWDVLNSITEEEAVKWAVRLLNLNYRSREYYNSMTHDTLSVDTLLQLQSVIHDYKTNEKTIFYEGSYHKLTKSQKFLLLFKVIKHWEHLEITYCI